MAIKIYNADDDQPVDLEAWKSGGQVIVLETPVDVVAHYRQVLEDYHRWLNTNTDIFDPVMAQITMEFEPGGDSLKLEDPYITDLVLHHLADEGLPVARDPEAFNDGGLTWSWVVINPDNTVSEPIAEAQA